MENLKTKKFDLTTRDKALNALHEIQLEGLKELDRICRKHGIKYSLGGGTCLGQIRHGGYIPWDDDIDIDMTTENYEKFLEIAPKELDPNRFYLRCYKTDKVFKRSFSRLEMKFTSLGPKKWKKIGLNSGIFVDIFEWHYLPNNKFLRKIVSSSLFYIRWMEMYKMLNNYTLNPRYRTFAVIMKKIIPTNLLFKLENKLKKCCKDKKTDWIIDNAIINGNHGGYPSNGIDEYEDVMFEGIKVMNKKNSHNFMQTIYGPSYNEWLPPIKRLSHHKWYRVNFGIYKSRFDLPKNYRDYLCINYTSKKLKHMKKVSLDMVSEIDRICQKNKLRYFVMGTDAIIKNYNIDEYGQYWLEPVKVAMPREDYDKFAELSKTELDKIYFYQSNKTDSEYKPSYARLRLNYTLFRETKIPKHLEEKCNNGFFIKIIPLDNTSDNAKKSKKHLKKIKRLNDFMMIKWTKNNLRAFKKGNIKLKIKLIVLLPFSVKKLKKMLDKVTNKYNKLETGYYIDSTGFQLKGLIVDKKILAKGIYLDYNEHKLKFPRRLSEYVDITNNVKKSKYKKYEALAFLKENYYSHYTSKVTSMIKKKRKNIEKKYSFCFLNYFDDSDYQLSVLRYDEKNDRFLTNEEIFASEYLNEN